MIHLLDAIKKIKPICPMEWYQVEREHVKAYLNNDCNKDMLKQKYQMLYLAHAPTIDPNCPSAVQRAKTIYHMIRLRATTSEVEEEEFVKEQR
jgi:hypothetical protein